MASCGTSYYASCYGLYLMKKFNLFNTVQAKGASELHERDLPIKEGGFLSVS